MGEGGSEWAAGYASDIASSRWVCIDLPSCRGGRRRERRAHAMPQREKHTRCHHKGPSLGHPHAPRLTRPHANPLVLHGHIFVECDEDVRNRHPTVE